METCVFGKQLLGLGHCDHLCEETPLLSKLRSYFAEGHEITSNSGCDMVLKDEIDSSNKISLLKKNPFIYLFHLFHNWNRRGYMLHNDFESKERLQEMTLWPIEHGKRGVLARSKLTC